MTSLPGTRPAPELPAGPRAALVVAISSYSDPALPSLGAAARDAIEMAEVLADHSIGGFEVTSVLDGTAREIRLAVHNFLNGRGREDLIVVYLSCHGLLDKQDRLYFAATDTSKDHLTATGVEAAWLWDRLDESRSASQVVILDCCNSGAFGRLGGKGAASTDGGLKQFVTQGRGRAWLMASRANQRAWVGDAVGGVASPSVFTSALVEGLRTGRADVDGDGYISVDEAYKYAYDKVVADGGGQIPQKSVSGGEGTLLLARNQVGLTVIPAALPEGLRVALDSAYPRIRMGAVDVLGGWLTGPDPARTLTARETLLHIAANEVPDVATVAREQLDRWVRAHEEAALNAAVAPAGQRAIAAETQDQERQATFARINLGILQAIYGEEIDPELAAQLAADPDRLAQRMEDMDRHILAIGDALSKAKESVRDDSPAAADPDHGI